MLHKPPRTIVGIAAFISLVPFAQADLALYLQNFEVLDTADPDALSADGWVVFGNVFDGVTGEFLDQYGPFPAPNGGPGFSGLVAGQGGPAQQEQQLVVYSDYGNTIQHEAGNRVEANVFQEQEIGPTDVGETWGIVFDARRGDLEPDSTALAFIKTIDPGAGFAVTNFLNIVMTDTPAMAWNTYQISIEIDATLVGQLLQFGFASTATNFENSGVFYDNVRFISSTVDSDSDGIIDANDNCLNTANPSQIDTNGDGFGNRCDADLNNDCLVNFADLSVFGLVMFTVDQDADFNGSGGIVDFSDFGIMRNTFYSKPAAGPGPIATLGPCDLPQASMHAPSTPESSVGVNTMFMVPADSTVDLGETIAIEINADIADATVGGGFDVFFDPAVLQVVDVSQAELGAEDFTDFGPTDNVDGIISSIAFGELAPLGNGGLAFSGLVATVTFEVIGVFGTTTITMQDNMDAAGPFYLASAAVPITMKYTGATLAFDTDGDGLNDAVDNCTQAFNPSQCDSDGDGFGNHCDGDLDNSGGIANFTDLGLFGDAFGDISSVPDFNAADFDCNGGVVGFGDLGLFKTLFGTPAGPSGVAP